jgi:hypothetical protein
VRGEAKAVTLLFPPPPLRGPRRAKLALEVREGGLRVVAPVPPPAPTNPISTKCTARNRCPTARAAARSANPRRTTSPRAAKAKSSSRPTRANPAPSSVPPPAPAVARRDIAAAGRRGRAQTASTTHYQGNPIRKTQICASNLCA